MLLAKLFIAFIQVGLFSVGGGYAAIPLIQEQIVNIYGLMTLSEFSDLITVAEMTPGPISINSATFVGMRIAGIPGRLQKGFRSVTADLMAADSPVLHDAISRTGKRII